MNHTIETQLCGQKLITIYFYNDRHPVVLFISEKYHLFCILFKVGLNIYALKMHY